MDSQEYQEFMEKAALEIQGELVKIEVAKFLKDLGIN